MNLSMVSTHTSTSPMKSSDAISDQFPAGLRVLVVDDDPTCLMILDRMLRACFYEVTKCKRAEVALSILRENKIGFDIVLSDVHMPDMDGFKLLEHIGLEMDLPVIMMSADDGKQVVMKGVTHGACDYLIKPVRIEALKNIWQHVVRRRKNGSKDMEQSGSVDEGDRQLKAFDDADYSSSANEGKSSKKRRDEEDDPDERDDSSTLKKARVVWSVELHQQFMAAVNQLGLDKAVPKKILELMNVPGLTRENVASHLQKYRLYLRRVSGVSPQQNHLNNPFISPHEASFAATSMNGIDLLTLQATGHISAQSLAKLQAAGLGRPSAKAGVSMSLLEQRNLFSFENPRIQFGESQVQHFSNSKPMNLLHGIPTNMEPKQLANLHQPSQSLGNFNMRVNSSMAQCNPSLMQTTLPNGISNAVFGNEAAGSSNITSAYNPLQQKSSVLSLPMNQSTEMAVTSGFVQSYDIFNELNHHKSNDWHLANAFDGSRHANTLTGNIDISPSVLVHQSFPPTSIGKGMFSIGDFGQHLNTHLVDNSVKVKAERVHDPYEQEDLMSALLKQQGGIGVAENEFDFDGYSLDNIPV